MEFLHRILAVLLAIFVASPLCCCAKDWQADHRSAQHSCCSGEGNEKQESVCNCPVAGPQATEDDATVVHEPVAMPAPPLGVPVSIPVPLAPSRVTQPPVEVDTGPPGTLLVVLQRFLI